MHVVSEPNFGMASLRRCPRIRKPLWNIVGCLSPNPETSFKRGRKGGDNHNMQANDYIALVLLYKLIRCRTS